MVKVEWKLKKLKKNKAKGEIYTFCWNRGEYAICIIGLGGRDRWVHVKHVYQFIADSAIASSNLKTGDQDDKHHMIRLNVFDLYQSQYN